MCNQPLKIRNKSRFIDLDTRDALYYYVPCGQCSECRKLKSLQWYVRTYMEFKDCISKGGYVLFDTLTYSNMHLPYIDSIVMDSIFHFPCFNHRDVQLWLKRLRKELKKRFNYIGLRYFLVSEYGTDPNRSHRPHYHVLLFCDDPNKVPFHELSKLVAKTWNKGRTDGIPYQSYLYVQSKRLFKDFDVYSNSSVCWYVSKYVNKSCEFQVEINKRISYMLDEWLDHHPSEKLRSPAYNHFKRVLSNSIGQFHRESLGFGLSLLDDDVSNILKHQSVVVPVTDKIVLTVPLCSYYKRKLFYELVDVDGHKFWQLNDLGKEMKPLFDKVIIDNIVLQFDAANAALDFDLSNRLKRSHYDKSDFADYVLNRRLRVRSFVPPKSVLDKLTSDDSILFNYTSDADCCYFGRRFYTYEFLGLPESYRCFPKYIVDYKDIEKVMCVDSVLESVYDDIMAVVRSNAECCNLYDYELERLNNLFDRLGFT